LESDDFNVGYDAQADMYCDLMKKGILDPTKVVLTAITDAASVAGLLITTECAIAEKPEPKSPMAPNPGMGGMDY
jgi:chaperonin GroEL